MTKQFQKVTKALLITFLAALVLFVSLPTETMAAGKKKAAPKKYVKSLSVKPASVTVAAGKSATVNATVKVKGKVNTKITVKSSNSSVATVSAKAGKKGKSAITIKGVKAGTAVITVKTKGKNKKKKALTKTINVTVKGAVAPPNPTPTPTPTPTDPTDPSGPTPGTEDVTLYMTPSDGVIRSEGTTVTLKAVPKKFGSTPEGYPKYQWYKDGNAVSGATQATYAAPAAGVYSCQITYPEFTIKSGTVTVTSTVVGPVSEKVTWTIEKEIFEGKYCYKEDDGKTRLYPIKLKREYVSFNPWPTTVAQVEYVIKNCKDPFVIGALYVVALDNYKYTKVTDSNCGKLCFDMLNTIALGAGALTETNPNIPQYTLTNTEKQNINAGAYNQLAYKKDGSTLSTHIVRDFAPRTFLKGATPENGYAPNGNAADINDKTKWKIKVDQYVYCFDQVASDSADVDPDLYTPAQTITIPLVNDKGEELGETETFENFKMPALHKDPTAITVCPTTYNLTTEDGLQFDTKEHNFGIRIGLQYSSKKNAWIPCDNVILNNAEHGAIITPIKKYLASNLFSTSHYLAPNDANDDL